MFYSFGVLLKSRSQPGVSEVPGVLSQDVVPQDFLVCGRNAKMSNHL